MKIGQLISLCSLVLLLCVSSVGAETLMEAWRSPVVPSPEFNGPKAVSVNPVDNSCWVADSGHSRVVHLNALGGELSRVISGMFNDPYSVSVHPGIFNPSSPGMDGSCWVADSLNDQVVHLDASGNRLPPDPIGGFYNPISVSVDSNDGSCWVADTYNMQVVHLSASGQVLSLPPSLVGAFSYPYSVSVDPYPSWHPICWVADRWSGNVLRIDAVTGVLSTSFLGTGSYPASVSVDTADHTCWVADRAGGKVVHLGASGGVILPVITGFNAPLSVSVNPTDHSCWVADWGGSQVVHLKADGHVLSHTSPGRFNSPFSVSVDPTDGSCWVADTGNNQVVHLTVCLGCRRRWDDFEVNSNNNNHSPFASFSLGAGPTHTRRQAFTGDLQAHSGLYAMSSEVTGSGVTGLRLDLPTEPSGPAEVTLRAWAYVADRTADDSSALFGFIFSPESLSPTVDPSLGLGWEVRGPDSSRYQLAGETADSTDGLTAGRWHLVQVRYTRASNTLAVWLNGELLSERAAPLAAGRAPAYLVLGAYGRNEAAHTQVLFDDVEVTLVGCAGPPEQNHPFALVAGPEQVAQDQTQTYDIAYGNGYQMLGLEEITETLPDTLYVGARLPEGYSFASADPAPSRVVDGVPVWELPLPAIGQAGLIHLTASTRTGLTEAEEGRLWTWATTDPDAGSVDPPAPPGDTILIDAVWGLPQDLLPQHIDLVARPDLCVRKVGPRFASPGDTIAYAITVGNGGGAAAEHVVVRDLMPSEMGGGDLILGNLATLDPGETWEGVISGLLPGGAPGGTLLLNRAYVPSGPPEVNYDNNISDWTTTVQAARDPNQISVSPTGVTDRGQELTYTLECENAGEGTAYGVYATAKLDRNLDATTLLVTNPEAVGYDPTSRTLVWDVGTLGASEEVSTSFMVSVADDAKRARPVVGQATVYFPSVPEETPTNVVVNTVVGSFSDVPWDHWAVLPVELAFENGIVGGYGDGTYRPTVAVSRDQMAVFISRALAGGDSHVPSGPPTATFSDVATSFWAFKYVEYAQSHGVVGGYPDGTYRPAAPVDRGQMAVFVARALAGSDGAVPAPPATPTFPDVTPTSTWAWAQKHVEYAVARGVVSGYPDGLYHPEVGVTRDQMAVFVARAFELPI